MSTTTSMPASASCRILVVDDDPIFRQLTISRLHKAGHRYDEAEDGIAAWQKIKDGSYDLALIDLDMPNMNGFSLIQCIRSFPSTQHMPLVVVTSREDASSVQKALEVGATGFLTKPVNWSMFQAHINHLLSLAQAAEEARIARRTTGVLADIRGSITDILNMELRARSRRIAATARRALEDPNDHADPQKLRNALALALSEADSQRAAVEQLAPYAELVSKLGEVNSTSFQLVQLLQRAIQDHADLISSKGLSVATGAPVDASLYCSHKLLSRAISDVLHHAVRRAPHGSAIGINYRMSDTSLSVSVTDDGHPLGQELTQALTHGEAGRTNPIRPVGPNGEIGVLMAASLLQMLGGRLVALPGQGDGATLVITLPKNIVSVPDAFHENFEHDVPERAAV